jgi:hypothetical protein
MSDKIDQNPHDAVCALTEHFRARKTEEAVADFMHWMNEQNNRPIDPDEQLFRNLRWNIDSVMRLYRESHGCIPDEVDTLHLILIEDLARTVGRMERWRAAMENAKRK